MTRARRAQGPGAAPTAHRPRVKVAGGRVRMPAQRGHTSFTSQLTMLLVRIASARFQAREAAGCCRRSHPVATAPIGGESLAMLDAPCFQLRLRHRHRD